MRVIADLNAPREPWKHARIRLWEPALLQSGIIRTLVLASDLLAPHHELGVRLASECKRQRIPTVSIQHASYRLYEDEPEGCRFAASLCCVHAQGDIDLYRSLGYKPHRLALTGSPKYDPLCLTLPLPTCTQLLLADTAHIPEKRIPTAAIDAAKRDLSPDRVLHRHHPTSRALKAPTYPHTTLTKPHRPLVDDLLGATHVLTTSPSVAFEALAAGRPTALCWSEPVIPKLLSRLTEGGLSIPKPPWTKLDWKPALLTQELFQCVSAFGDGLSALRCASEIFKVSCSADNVRPG